MPRSNSQSKALFYPNLCCSVQVRVALDGLNSQNRDHFHETKDITIYASNDMGTASSETRHFIDLNFLLTLLGNQKQLVRSMLTAPTRPCSRLVGVGGGDNKSCRVLGMLAEPLNVRLCNVESPTQTIWTPIILPTNVLVVQSLPVPLHISLKTLQVYPREQSAPFQQILVSAPQYKQHPYWCKNNNMNHNDDDSSDSEEQVVIVPDIVFQGLDRNGNSPKRSPQRNRQPLVVDTSPSSHASFWFHGMFVVSFLVLLFARMVKSGEDAPTEETM